jgi:hypothetical protein
MEGTRLAEADNWNNLKNFDEGVTRGFGNLFTADTYNDRVRLGKGQADYAQALAGRTAGLTAEEIRNMRLQNDSLSSSNSLFDFYSPLAKDEMNRQADENKAKHEVDMASGLDAYLQESKNKVEILKQQGDVIGVDNAQKEVLLKLRQQVMLLQAEIEKLELEKKQRALQTEATTPPATTPPADSPLTGFGTN